MQHAVDLDVSSRSVHNQLQLSWPQTHRQTVGQTVEYALSLSAVLRCHWWQLITTGFNFQQWMAPLTVQQYDHTEPSVKFANLAWVKVRPCKHVFEVNVSVCVLLFHHDHWVSLTQQGSGSAKFSQFNQLQHNLNNQHHSTSTFTHSHATNTRAHTTRNACTRMYQYTNVPMYHVPIHGMHQWKDLELWTSKLAVSCHIHSSLQTDCIMLPAKPLNRPQAVTNTAPQLSLSC